MRTAGCTGRDLLRRQGARRRRSPVRESGSATVWVLALATIVWTLGVAVMMVGQARAARHQAGAAADLAALAAAARLPARGSSPCATAARVAAGNGARLTRCTVRGRVVDVTVEVPLHAALAALLPTDMARMRARAGPAYAATRSIPAAPSTRP